MKPEPNQTIKEQMALKVGDEVKMKKTDRVYRVVEVVSGVPMFRYLRPDVNNDDAPYEHGPKMTLNEKKYVVTKGAA